MSMEKSAVVIPVYKENLNKTELASLNQTGKILNNFPVILVMPDDLNAASYLKVIPDAKIERFARKYFGSIKGYNSLLLSKAFYQRFNQYKYILLTQLDVWVFEDQFQKWIDKDYDYIGAPWLELPPKQKAINLLPMGQMMLGKVGNGGFSLRKISSHIRIAGKLSWISWVFRKNEDFFWSIIVPDIYKSYKIPSLNEALYFAFELAPERAYEMTDHTLPFGVHAWEKHNPAFWKRFISL